MGEVDDFFGLSITEAEFDDGAVAATAKDVDRLAISGERRPTVEAGAEQRPFLSL